MQTLKPGGAASLALHKPESGTGFDNLRLSRPLGFDAAYACSAFSALRVDQPTIETKCLGRSTQNLVVTVWGVGSENVQVEFCGERLKDQAFRRGLCSIAAKGSDFDITMMPSAGSNFVFFIDPKKFEETFHDDDDAGRCLNIESDLAACDGFLVNRMAAYLEEHQKAGPFAGIGMQTVAMEVSLHLARNYSIWVDRGRLSFISVAEPERIARAKDYVEACLDQPISLADLAQVACLSQYHFSRCFKALEGISPYQYVLKRRLTKAKSLLTQSSMPIAEIAQACGFSSQQHLGDQFRKAFGQSPGALRRDAAW